MSKYKYFSDEEIQGLKDDLCCKLDCAREFFGAPIVITSGYRSPEQNEAKGGVKDSAHTKGLAVDIRAPADNGMREKLVWSLGNAGFKRIGAYDRHFHVDVDRYKPTPSFWTGVSG